MQNFSTSPRQPHHAVPKRSRRQGITAAKSVGGRTRGWKSRDRGGRGHAGEATLYDKSQQQNESKSGAPFYSGMHGSFRISSLMQYTQAKNTMWIGMHMNKIYIDAILLHLEKKVIITRTFYNKGYQWRTSNNTKNITIPMHKCKILNRLHLSFCE